MHLAPRGYRQRPTGHRWERHLSLLDLGSYSFRDGIVVTQMRLTPSIDQAEANTERTPDLTGRTRLYHNHRRLDVCHQNLHDMYAS
jgi:hypothetical protein